ncbi:MAG: HsdR family type I site-specific deoxyribonuclease [Dehalococcoides mccartyi]|uniref:type I restriction endonuclease subunit R n=1 Tax=Dehalococcoides mccartyi TaxID=61435 RepID=UPI0025C86546|nr:HsdR family type I site-specific deoxyribonuclease [Dehalococcoides mccartyi]MDN4186769.1 HsdR family type I site-specific deoxyribonuclease [Dehalococcoides mccartyi]
MPNHTIFNERPESQDRALKVIEKLGYTIVPRSEAEEKRGSRRAVLFEKELQAYLSRQTYPYNGERRFFSGGSIAAAVRAVDLQSAAGLYAANKECYDLLCSGKSLEETLPDGTRQSFDISFIDFEHPENNILQVTDEFEVERPNGKFARPDLVVLVNGIPLVVIECKKSSVDVMEGVAQNIRNWGNDYIPQLFQYSQLVIAVNPDKVLYGTCGTASKYFVSWHEDDKEWLDDWCRKCSPDGSVKEQDRALISLLHPERLLDIIRNFIIYDNNVKKIARYRQFFAVKKCMNRILLKDGANTRNGVVWHTQGSGKTLTMIMLTKMILRESMKPGSTIRRPRFIMVTDRINLDKQIRDNFIYTQMSPHRAKTGKGLIELLQDEGNTVITALVNKFEAAVKQEYCNESPNIFLFIDEGHRTQYGRLNIYMTKVLPNAAKIAFTGTPLIKKPKENDKRGIESARNTYLKFGPEIDRYTLQDAIDDKVTVPLVYEGRVVPQKVTSEQINAHLKHITVGLTEEARKDLEMKYSRFVALAQTEPRLNMIAFDLHEHFLTYVRPKHFKAMLTCSSRAAAVQMFYKLRDLGGITPAVIITPNSAKEGDDEENTPQSQKIIGDFFRKEVDPLYKNNYDAYEDSVTGAFVDPEGDIDLLIVKDKLLTGFDAPIAAVLYVDKKLQDHTLLQAIARVNRVYENKDFGLIVDYIGIFKKLNTALDLYSDVQSGMDSFDKVDIENAISTVSDEKTKLDEAHKELWKIFDGISRNETSADIWQERLREFKVRKDFYDKLSSFAKQVDFMFSSYELYQAVGDKKAEEYRRDYLFFKKLKDSVSLRFNDSVDFSKYEDGIRQLLNTYVNADDVKTVIEPLDISNKAKMEEQLARLGSNEAKAEAIQTRQVEILESHRYDDPIQYMTFMERINKTIQDYLAERDSEKYLTSMERMAEDYRAGRSAVTYPEVIMDDGDAKAFYGAVCSGVKKAMGEMNDNDEESLGNLALNIKNVVASNAKRDWRDNVIVHRNVKKELDDLLFDYLEEHKLNWTLDTIDIIIDEIMMVAKKVY